MGQFDLEQLMFWIRTVFDLQSFALSSSCETPEAYKASPFLDGWFSIKAVLDSSNPQ